MSALVMVHVLASVVLATASVLALAATMLARRSSSPKQVLVLLRFHNLFAAKTLVPASVAVLLTGAYLTYAADVSLLAFWMFGSLAIFALSALGGILFLLPEERRATAEAQRLIDAGSTTISDELRQRTGSPAIVAGEWGAQFLLIAMFWLMIAKPV